MPSLTAEQTTPISEAFKRMNERRNETPHPVEWRYFQACERYEEAGLPQQYFIVCTQDELRTIKTGNIIAAGIQSATFFAQWRRQRGPGIDGWYVKSHSKDGSRTWYLLGGTVEEVVAYYDSL